MVTVLRTALHGSAEAGQLAVTKLLVKAVGGDMEAKACTTGSTPLHMAVEHEHFEVLRVLIEAGANPNSRRLDGATSLSIAAQTRHPDAIKVLLRAGADPLLTYSYPGGECFVPLDAAAYKGRLEVAHELIQQFGIEGCGGASGGVHALQAAAQNHHMEMMGMLTNAGVVDTGKALQTAVAFGQEPSVKFLLQQQQQWKTSGQGAGYLDTSGRTPLVCM